MKHPIELTDNLQETMDRRPRVLPVFLERRMACPGCDMAPFETVADAADAYRLPPSAFLAALREADGES